MTFRVLLALPLAGLLAACTAPGPAPEAEPGPEPVTYDHYVALGDSFAAMGSRSATTTGPFECFRSVDNYPSLVLADDRVTAGEDVTCSSAVTADIPGQAAALTPDTDLVTLSIGGNDIRFGEIAACFRRALTEPLDCPTLLDAPVSEQLSTVPGKLDEIHTLIAETSPDARVIVTGYLPLVAAGDCPQLATIPEEHRAWAVSLTDRINDVVREAAERHGAEFVLPADAAAHSACAEPGERWADIIGTETDAYPMHPTPVGQRAMADAVVDQI